MSPRHPSAGLPALALAALLLASACGGPGGRARNVVIVVVDTLRHDHVGSYGHERDTSPAIDALAAGGTRFERAYATAPWTKPSVASLLTGLYPSAHGVRELAHVLPEEAVTLPEILAGHGYRRAGVVSHSMLSDRDGFGQGCETYLSTEARGHRHVSTAGVTAQAVAQLRDLAAGPDPFYLFVHYFDPHYSYMPHPETGLAPERVGRLVGGEDISLLWRFRDQLTEEEVGFLRDLYDGEIRHTDDGIRALLEELDRVGAGDDTLVVITADHGEEFRERGWIGHTRTLYEELIRVPLVIRAPGERPRVVGDPVSLVSLTPTILDLLGLDADGRVFQGSSFADRVRGRGGTARRIFAELDYVPLKPNYVVPETRKKALIDGRHKIVLDEMTATTEVFDLAADPEEARDLSSDAALERRLADLLGRFAGAVAREAVTADDRPLSDDEVEMLRSLGYVSP